ncbi:putative inorganic phosphate cotransporter isoform X2 [Onthophagus taurus]
MVVAEMAVKCEKTAPSPCAVELNGTTLRSRANDENKQQWSQQDQAVLLASFFVGYVLMHLPGGYISDKFGARIIFTLSICISSFCTILFPLIVDYCGFVCVVIFRAIIGIAQASVFPNVTTLMGRWIPKTERATMGGIAFAANSWGIVIGNLVTGVFHQALGWRSVFYIWGALGITWYFFALIWLYSDPDSCPVITEKEYAFLNENIPKKEELKLDVKGILLDPAVWALVAGQFGHAYLIFFLATNMPKYFSEVLNVNMKQNMWVNSMPYILQWISSVISGQLGDYNIKKRGWDVNFTRKFYTTVASVLPSICLLIMPYLECEVMGVIILLCLSLFTMGPFYCGLKVNVIDLTKNFSGFVMAIVNGLGAVAGIMSPSIVGWLAPDHTFEQWVIVMWIIFAIASITNIIYVIWGEADRRPWDMNPDEKAAYHDAADKKKAEKAAKKAEKKANKSKE